MTETEAMALLEKATQTNSVDDWKAAQRAFRELRDAHMEYKGHEITIEEEKGGAVIYVDGERVDGWFNTADALPFAKYWIDNPPKKLSDLRKEANNEQNLRLAR
jgi:hypothetical protein